MTAALHQATSTIPIVFAIVTDPVGSGFVAGLPRPGGNITGFTHIEAAMGGKWLSLLKEIAPSIKRAAFMFNPETAPAGGKNFLASFETAAGSLGIEPVAIPVRSDAEIETAITALGAEQAGLVEFSPFMAAHVGTVISSAARHNVPAIFEGTLFASKGGLIAYGASFTDMFRRAAVYVDRILRGERPADLPVQTPTKFEMIINLKTAKALGLNAAVMLAPHISGGPSTPAEMRDLPGRARDRGSCAAAIDTLRSGKDRRSARSASPAPRAISLDQRADRCDQSDPRLSFGARHSGTPRASLPPMSRRMLKKGGAALLALSR